MKQLIFSFLLLLLGNNIVLSQTSTSDYYNYLHSGCETVDNNTEGLFPYFPVDNDVLKILVIFAKFPDDTWDPSSPGQATYYWPGSSTTIPTWADNIIKPNLLSIGNDNMTAYSRDASGGKFHVIGDVYPDLYIYENNSSYYRSDSQKRMGYAVKEALLNLDKYIDYSEYDNYDPLDYNNNKDLREPDGYVDFVIVVNRFHLGIDPYSYSGIAALGGWDYRFGYDNGNPVYEIGTDDGVSIKAGYPGSGAISQQLTPWGYSTHMHELGHYLWGGHRSLGWWNLMNTNGNSFVSADEKETLGWEGTIHTPSTNTTYNLADYGTTGDFIKFSRGGKTYYLEYRKRVNYHLSENWKTWPYYSVTPSRPLSPDSGLFVHNSYNDWTVAQGRFDWEKSISYPTRYVVDTLSDGTLYNRFFWTNSNRTSGEDTRDLVNKPAVNYFTGAPFVSNKTHSGDAGDSNSCFDVGYNQVYSQWSNPRIHATGDSDSLAIEIQGKTGDGKLIVAVYFDNVIQTAPSKPQDLVVSEEYYGLSDPSWYHPKLNWSANLEPDMSTYKIYRGNITTPGVEPSSYSYLTSTSSTEYIDESISLYPLQAGGGICTYNYRTYAYRVTAVDNTSKESVKSERDTIWGYTDPCAPERPAIGGEEENIIPTEYALKQNFPNPFNPETNIQFDLPDNNFVSLKIYDIMGREVAILVNEFKNAGKYIASFNAASLSSGIYFYKIQAGNFIETKRMILIK